MSAKEYTAKSVEEALEKALNEMMLTREDIHYEIVQQPSKGFLGFGQKDAVVRVSKKDAAETKVEAVEVKDVKTEEKAEVKAEIPVQEPTPVVEEEKFVVVEEAQPVVEEPVAEKEVVEKKPIFSFNIDNIDFSDDDEAEIPVSTFEKFEDFESKEKADKAPAADDDNNAGSGAFRNFFKKK